jgi:rod shape-determining protein MreC
MLRRLLRLVFEFYDYILFLFLIILALLILMSNEVPQVRAIQGDIIDTFAFFSYPAMWVNRLTSLQQKNEVLRQEILQLRIQNAQMEEAVLENQRLHQMLNFMDSTRLMVLPARVLSRGSTPIYNSILISLGEQQGIQPNMAVISTDGIVGKTVSVGDRTTLVQVVNDANFRISVKFQRSRALGIAHWINSNHAQVPEIPKTIVIEPGEKILTSGYSGIYPENLVIGTVVGVNISENGLYQIAEIQPTTDLNRIEAVFVVLKH